MISIQLIRDDPDGVKRAIARKGERPEVIDRLLAADERRRALLAEADAAKHERNEGSRAVGELMRSGQTAEAEARKASLGQLGERIDALDAELAEVEAAIEADLLLVPNPPHDAVPDGRGPEDNPVVRTWGEPLPPGQRPPHWEIGARLGLFDLERGAKISGSGFVLYTGAGARLQRALIGLFLDM
ncbi:MAG: serine--tRNA ligase, partial [Chloroflexota bacterium]